ncbi:unnamed protein product [Linum tenue]|uniref:Uncharacterized protein n=1 Tax=Linum tenue TaxID=586396 RepID=A0AAV0N331_9ROSI|nr:unnamed protein product [Linum tenue]
MENSLATLLLLVLFLSPSLHDLPLTADAISGCGDHCRSMNDCEGKLICIHGECGDDPDIGSDKCGGGDDDDEGEHRSKHKPTKKKKKTHKKRKHNGGGDDDGGGGGGDCRANGTKDCGDGSYETYTCSPPVTSETRATLTVNSFEDGGDGGGPSECDGVYHSDDDKVVALSTGWYEGGSRCGKMIRITQNGKSVEAMVVDECDSMQGCDQEHAGLPPCKNNIVDGSPAVWDALGLAQDEGEVPVTWTMA